MNELPENSNNNEPGELATLDYLRGVKSSTCLLIPTTPSPTPLLDFKHPLSEEMAELPLLTINGDMGNSQNSDASAGGDSSSSADSNSVVQDQDPVSAQLINNISMLDYQTLSKNGDLILGPVSSLIVEDSKLNGNLNTNNRKLPGFVNWNWAFLRRALLWVVVSGLVACVAAILAMVATIPKDCNPHLPWYHGKVIYEVYPASFQDSNNDGMGDLKGIIEQIGYIKNLGASAIRLNNIFEVKNYPIQYYNVTCLRKVATGIGTCSDIADLVSALLMAGMHLVLDLPVISMIPPNMSYSATTDDLDDTSKALALWAQSYNVDGFYLKNLEKFVDHELFAQSLQFWKNIIGANKILIASEEAYKKVKGDSREVFLSRIDLIDIHLDMKGGIHGLKKRIEEVISGDLWEKPHYPWVHWNIGDFGNQRISSKYVNNTLTLFGLELVLPGTISIFYGDEIGLSESSNDTVETDFHEHKDLHNLLPMKFSNNDKNENNITLPWNSESATTPKYNFIDIIRSFTTFRLDTPTIYVRAIYKDGSVLKNMEIHNADENLLIIERWYPRRNTCVYVGNLGSYSITTDMSSMFYGGTVVAGTNATMIGEVLYFNNVTFPPYSAILLKLEK